MGIKAWNCKVILSSNFYELLIYTVVVLLLEANRKGSESPLFFFLFAVSAVCNYCSLKSFGNFAYCPGAWSAWAFVPYRKGEAGGLEKLPLKNNNNNKTDWD